MIYVDRNSFNISLSERVIGHYGDNAINSLTFEIGESFPECEYILYIKFSDNSINSIKLDKGESNTAIWNIKAEHIFTSGIAYIQIKAVSKNEEIWHSPKTAIEIFNSIDENKPCSKRIPSIFEQFDSKINDLSQLIESCSDLLAGKDFITKSEAGELISESINNLLLPLNKRLDGE